jgi:hypothetical protein
MSFREQPRQLLFFGQTSAFLDKLSDKWRCDLRVNEGTAETSTSAVPMSLIGQFVGYHLSAKHPHKAWDAQISSDLDAAKRSPKFAEIIKTDSTVQNWLQQARSDQAASTDSV